MSQKITTICLGVAIIAFVAVAIFVSSGDNTQPDKNDAQQVVDVGVSLALTGDASFIGESYQQGLEIAADDINDSPKINLQYQDNKNSGKSGVSAFRALNQSGSDIILSTFSAPTVSLSPLAKQENLPLFVSVVFADVLSKNSNAISFFPRPQDDARATIKDLKAQGVKDVAVIYQQSEYGQSGFAKFRQLAEDNGFNVVHSESYTPETVEFTTPVLKTLQNEPDAVYVVAVNATPIIRQLKSSINDSENKPVLYSNLIPTFGNLHHKNPNVFEGVHLTALSVSIPNSEDRKKFLKKQGDGNYRNDSLGYEAVAYDNLTLLHEVLKKNSNPSEFVDTFQSYGKFSGVTGTYRVDSRNEGMNLKPVVYNGNRLEKVNVE